MKKRSAYLAELAEVVGVPNERPARRLLSLQVSTPFPSLHLISNVVHKWVESANEDAVVPGLFTFHIKIHVKIHIKMHVKITMMWT
jgi:hypothetical protein